MVVAWGEHGRTPRVNATAQYQDHAGRPHPVLPFGKAIEELL
jgi:hypothetical protein